MKDFILNNWQLIATVILLVIQTILYLLLKKNPKIIDNSIFYFLLQTIEYAEAHYKLGSEKLDYVLSEAKKRLGPLYNETAIRNMVEWILTLPEKKGDK